MVKHAQAIRRHWRKEIAELSETLSARPISDKKNILKISAKFFDPNCILQLLAINIKILFQRFCKE